MKSMKIALLTAWPYAKKTWKKMIVIDAGRDTAQNIKTEPKIDNIKINGAKGRARRLSSIL